MKTFTTYAEKKAKQFLNLLQGYTKGIRLTAILILLLMGVSNAWAGASWIGNSFIVANGTWYNASGTGQTAGAFHNKNLGSITSLTLGGEIQTYGQTDGAKNPAKMHYQISGKNAAYITLYWFKYQDNNNFFHSNSNGSTSSNNTFASKTIDISSLTPGNYTLSVWFEQPDGGQWDSNNSSNYKATFTIDPVVTFKANGGTGNDYTQTVKYNTSTALTANKFTRTGYSFSGWKTAANSGTSYANQASVKFTANTTLYAQWTPAKYTINYKDQNNANFTGSHASGYPTQHTYGTETTLSTASKTGYTFGGWHTDQACTNKVTSLGATAYTANITLYAKWTENTYTVTINNDEHGTTTPSGAQSNVGQVTGVGISATAHNGYQFENWTITSGSGSFTSTTATTTTFKPTAASTIQANFSPIEYNITYENLNGVTHTNRTTYTIEDTPLTFTNPTSERTGYTFNGWSPASIAQGSTGHQTITAQWTAKTFTVTLSQEEATTPGTTSVTATYDAVMPSITTPTRTGYTFGGYWTEKEGQGTQYYKADGASAKNWDKTTDTELYAKWTINQYTIKYGVCAESRHGDIQLNGGTKVKESATSGKIDYNTEVTLTATPESQDYKIEGWYSDANCANKIQAAGDNSTYTFTLTDNTTVYVKFADAKEQMSLINVSATSGGSVSPSGTVEVGDKTSSVFTATPAPGYKFKSWTYTSGVKEVSQNNTDQEGRITITASAEGSLVANFVRVYTITYYNTFNAAGTISANASGANVTSGDAFEENTIITFVATPNTQCNFIKWINGAGELLSTDATYDHTVTDDITVKPVFTINQYTLTFSAGEGGHVSATANNSAIASPATLDYNTSVTLTAEPSANCVFDKWVDENNNEIKEGNKSIGATYTFNLTANKTVKATFTKGTTIFFKPVDYWKEADARFAVYTWGASVDDKWIEFEDYGCNEDIFTAEIPAGYTGFKIVRLKPASADGYNSAGDGFNWDNRWAETVNLTIPTGDKNLYDMNNKTITKLYFTPHDNWKSDGARFAACFMDKNKGNHTWVSMSSSDNIYNCAIPNGTWKYVIFCRMNPSAAANNWNNKWNQTGDIEIPTNGQNHYTITELGNTWDDIKTADWSTLFDDSRWTTYAAPSYTLTIQSTANGTVAVSKVGGGALATNETIKLGDEITITFTPNDGHELSNYLINYASETETDGVYTVCGPTKIIAEFDPIAPSRTVYLRPNEDWLRDNPIMAAYAYNNSGNRWYVMNTTDDDYTGAYSCKIPSEYDKVIFVRLNPNGSDKENDGFNFKNAWNQTKDLTIIDKDNDKTNDHKLRFAIGDKIVGGNDSDKYDGKWEENTPIWGLIANFNDWKAEKAIFMGYPGKLNTVPPFTPQHAFKLFNFFYAENSNYFGNAGTMERENSEQWWTMDVNEQANCQMKLDAKGDYIYQLRFLTVGPDLRKQISVIYPETTNVYTLLYEYTIDSQTKSRMSYEIAAVAGEQLDTISFHVLKNSNPKIKLLKNATVQGTAVDISVESDSVYNFVLEQTDGRAQLLNAANPEVYTGNYYVRTDAATGGWNAYKQEGNRMTYSSYSDKNQNFDHYFCKWIDSPEPEKGNNQTNVKFCVANDYSHALSDELNGDEIIEKTGVATGCLPDSANVRFAWDSKTNELSRAYISGSAYAKDRFLVLTGNKYLLDIDSTALNVSGLKANEALFADKQNWIYQLDVQANSNTEITLTAQYNNKVQTFFGTAKSNGGSTPIMQATNDKYHKVRMIYDFKTNNLIAAWLLDSTQNVEATHVASNMLIIREDQGVANQINFASNGNQDMEIYTAYAVMTFTKNWVTGAATRDRSEYWVSFPFDVKISDVFGFSEYGDKWIMQLYDGAERAEKGNWIDSPTFWKYITNRNYTLKAGVGYVLKLNLNKMDFPNNSTDASLFFPSQGIPTVINAEPTPIMVPAHECTIERDNRDIYDSHWNLIGVPGYANIADFNTDASLSPVEYKNEEVSFYYAYDAANNTYQATSKTSNFKNMHSYMVQFAGIINWSTKAVTPAQLAARRNSDAEPEKRTLRLEIAQGEEVADQTFVQLQQEGATPEFDMNLDLTKIINSGANIYTLVGEGQIQTAGNVLSMGETTVPVGVKVDAEGEYTFRMPDGTEGMVVELIDYETNTRTNLLLSDYIVTLPKGTNEGRFALHIQPSKSGVTTGIDQINGGSMHHEGVQKYLIDGQLYIVREGVVYDAQGHRL